MTARRGPGQAICPRRSDRFRKPSHNPERLLQVIGSLCLLWLPTVLQAQVRTPAASDEGMILVPAGEFKMGSTEDDRFAEDDEMPQRVVQLPAFYIDQFEVSNIEYKRFIDATGYPAPPGWVDGNYTEDADFYPVYDVSWWDARAYARWRGKRLPTEAEWEKAARGPDARRFPWGEDFREEFANATEGYMPINAKMEGASIYGVANMAGNVAEWTESVYAPYPEISAELPGEFGGAASSTAAGKRAEAPGKDALGSPPRPGDPLLQFFGAEELRDERPRVYRGGSFNNFTRYLRCANREHAKPRERWYNIGFRCAMDVERAKGKDN